MAMGFDSLSMNATNLPKVKWMLRQINLSWTTPCNNCGAHNSPPGSWMWGA